jgi:hypothetical protein
MALELGVGHEYEQNLDMKADPQNMQHKNNSNRRMDQLEE